MNRTFVLFVSSPESECGWVLWTRGSVLFLTPSLHGQSPRFLHSHLPLVTHLSVLTGLPSAESAICYWVQWLSPSPQRRESTGSKDNLTSSQQRGVRQMKSKTQQNTVKAGKQAQREREKSEKQINCHVTCPQTSSPSPRKTHHIHFSRSRGWQLNGFPPNCTITICTVQNMSH